MEYLTRNEVKKYKEEIQGIINDLKNELGNEWNLYYYLVGSGRRNMVVKSNEGFDLDYHLILKKNPSDLTDEEIKRKIMEAIDSVKPNHLSNSKDSTNVITLKCIEDGFLKYSYDLAIMKKEKDGSYSILRNEKDNGSNGPYHFVTVSDSSDFFTRFSKIKGTEMWRDLRESYLEKKKIQHREKKENRMISFSYLKLATNEILQKYNII